MRRSEADVKWALCLHHITHCPEQATVLLFVRVPPVGYNMAPQAEPDECRGRDEDGIRLAVQLAPGDMLVLHLDGVTGAQETLRSAGLGQLGHLTKGKTGHLSNPKIVQLTLALGTNPCYTAGSKLRDEMTQPSQVARPLIARIGDSLKSQEGSYQ